MNFIDTHSHLYLKDFDLDIDEEIKTSIGLGIREFYLPSIDSSYTNRMIKLKNKYPCLCNNFKETCLLEPLGFEGYFP